MQDIALRYQKIGMFTQAVLCLTLIPENTVRESCLQVKQRYLFHPLQKTNQLLFDVPCYSKCSSALYTLYLLLMMIVTAILIIVNIVLITFIS